MAPSGTLTKAQKKDLPEKRLVWLASYPKSGNTWTRILLANLLKQKHDGEDIDLDPTGSISSNRPRFDNITGLPSSDLTDDEIDLLRPDLYREMARNAQAPLYIKVHDAWHRNLAGVPLFPASHTIGTIYLVRNPLDVAVSYAFHQGHEDFEKTVANMGRFAKSLAGGNKTQLRQLTFGWSGHYKSWTEQDEIPVLCIRYEDMLTDTVLCLQKMASFLGLPQADDHGQLKHAVEQSRFDRLQAKEQEAGFREKPAKAAKFFRSGKAGEGLETLPEHLIETIINDHGDVMRQLGYL